MIQIGICEDEHSTYLELKEIVLRTLFQYDEIHFSYYESGEKLIEDIQNRSFHCNLLLLDIHMKGRNGLETAAYIRNQNVDVDIIFVTVSKEHVFDGYLYQAFSYILKPVDESRLGDELVRYMKLKRGASRCLHVKIGNKQVQIILDRVKYFSAEGRKCIAHQIGKEDKIEFYAKMGDLQSTLAGESFLRCHQSYYVNTNYVDTVSRTVLGVDGEDVPVSRKYLTDVKAFFGG